MAEPLTEALLRELGLKELFPEPREKPGHNTQAQQLVDLALAEGVEFFHTPDQTAYASIPVDGHIETWPVRKLRFWLSRLFYAKNKKPPGSQALQDALNDLESKALFEGICCSVNTRIACQQGKVYLDLANDAWQAVEVSPSGWRLLDRPPVKFRRTKGMQPLPVPQKGGSLDLLREFVNVADENQWVLLVSWLLAAFRPVGPYPVLLLQGEQGCAKSTTARVLKALVDSNISPLRASPRNEQDLLIGATNGWVLAFDNLSGIPNWLSDAFCRLSTGGGLATRQLYSDDEEVILDAQRPVILNGIDDLVWRHDLLDRSIVLNLPVIPENRRKPEAKFWQEFEEARPYILGAVLDVVAAGLRNLLNIKLDRLPRMADFALWVTACEEALPWEPGKFMEAYTGNRQEQIDSALENDPVAQAVKRLLDECGGSWEGKASELLNALEELAEERVLKSRSWPESEKALGRRLKRSATFLRQAGIEVEFARVGRDRTRLVSIYKADVNADIMRTFADIKDSKMSADEARIFGVADITDKTDINFYLESKNQKERSKEDTAGKLMSETSALSASSNIGHSKADIKNSLTSAKAVLCPPEQSELWNKLLNATVSNEELTALLSYARTCGAELTFSSNGWRIEAREALGPDYMDWRRAMLPHVKELQTALAKLP